MLHVSDAWKTSYPGAAVGVLVMKNVTNPENHPLLNKQKEALEAQLRARFASGDRATLRALPVFGAYRDYYKRFKKTYHVLLQLESVAFKGKPIPRVAGLVESMFMAELKNQLLTAGHDFEVVEEPIRLDVAQGDESYLRINGRQQVLKAGDMYIADAQGILSSVIYGPDQRTRITSATRQAVFTVYAPPGIDPRLVEQHLGDIQSNIHLFAPDALTETMTVYRSA